jgi:hypothetical protein
MRLLKDMPHRKGRLLNLVIPGVAGSAEELGVVYCRLCIGNIDSLHKHY